MAITEKNIRNIFIYATPRFLSYGINLLILPILTRILTPEDFGVVTLALLFPTISSGVLTFGLPAAAARFYFEYRADEQRLEALYFSCQVFLYFSLVLSALAVFYFKEPLARLTIGSSVYGTALFISFVGAYLSQVVTFYLRIYQNMERATLYAAFVIVQSTVTALSSLILVAVFKMSYMGVIYASLIGPLFVCLALLSYFNRGHRFLFNGRVLLDNIKYGLQVVPKAFTGFINRFFDKYMLNNMLSLTAVGVYNIGQTVGNAMFFLMDTSWQAFQPVCFREVFDKGAEGSKSVGRLFTLFAYLTLTPVFLLVLFAQEVVYIVAPASYYKAIDVIIIVLGGIATQAFGVFVSVQYAYTKKAFLIFPITVAGALVNIGANILLIPRFGIAGAAFSTVLTYLTINGLITFVGQKLYRIEYEWKDAIALFGLIAAAIGSVLYLRSTEANFALVYLVKLILLVLFVVNGIRARVLTRLALERILRTFSIRRGTGEVEA